MINLFELIYLKNLFIKEDKLQRWYLKFIFINALLMDIANI